MSPRHPSGLDVSKMSRSSNESYSFKSAGPDRITCAQRIWDGVDKPDYTPVFSGNTTQARKWIQELELAVEASEDLAAQQETQRRADLVKSIAALQSELEGLDRVAARRAEAPTTTQLAAQIEGRSTSDHG